jgi:hypothetical protein
MGEKGKEFFPIVAKKPRTEAKIASSPRCQRFDEHDVSSFA